jgi:hypothetical protein
MGLKDRIPSILPVFREGSDLGIVVDTIDSEFDEFGTDISDVQDSLFVETADGQSLDLIAEELSIIARRRGRDDDQYRQFLQGLVPAFDGRGTERDVEVAVAAGVTFDADAVDLIQDFSGTREYQVELLNSDWVAHSSATTRELAEIADPVAVDRVDPVILFTEEVGVAIQTGATETGIDNESEEEQVAFAVGDTIAETATIGLSSPDLEPLSTDGFILSIRDAPSADVVFNAADTGFATNFISPDARPSANVADTVVRPMTDLPSATPRVNTSGTGTQTLTRDGLSSLQLGELSTPGHEPLST